MASNSAWCAVLAALLLLHLEREQGHSILVVDLAMLLLKVAPAIGLVLALIVAASGQSVDVPALAP